jgi:4-amino-4-deoxy-L-arabinose transferase-like glycosyltransferase
VTRFLRSAGGSPISWTATALFLVLMTLWTVVTPEFRSPDEPQHANSVLRLAEGGGWPEPATAFLLPEVIRAKTLTGFSAVDGQHGNWGGGTLLPGVRSEIPSSDLKFYALFSQRPVTPPADRLPFDDLRLTQPVEIWQHGDQMTQHPPLYYALSAGIVWITGSLDWPFDRTLGLMRLVSVALVMWLPLMAFSVTRVLTGNRRLADVASVLPLAIPQLAYLGGSVTNDALVVFLGGLTTVLLARVLRGDLAWRTLLILAGTLGLALLTKGSLLLLVPLVGLGVVVGARRAAELSWRPTLLRLLTVWGVAFAVGGWWWALNIVRYGTIQPAGILLNTESEVARTRPRSSVFEFAEVFWDKMTNSFWGTFGWLELPLDHGVALVATVIVLALVALSFRRRGSRLNVLILVSFCLATALAVFSETYQSHLAAGTFGGMQGRYLFGGLVPVFAAIAIGLGRFGRDGGRLERWLPAVVIPVALASAAYGLWVAFSGFYIDVGWSLRAAWQRMVDWSPWPDLGARGLVVTLMVLSVVAFVLAVRAALRRDEPVEGQPLPPAEAPSAGPSTVAVGADHR